MGKNVNHHFQMEPMENSAVPTFCQPVSDLIERTFECRLDIQPQHPQIERSERPLPPLSAVTMPPSRQQQRSSPIPRVLHGPCMVDEALHPARRRQTQQQVAEAVRLSHVARSVRAVVQTRCTSELNPPVTNERSGCDCHIRHMPKHANRYGGKDRGAERKLGEFRCRVMGRSVGHGAAARARRSSAGLPSGR